MSSVMTPALDHVVLFDIRWPTFEAILSDLGDHRGSRIAYDRGTLEIMSPSREHEALKTLIGRMIEVFTLELGIKISSCGSTTLKSALEERGVEPDECYYVQNEAAVRGKHDLNLERDPPPDLVLEVDISRSSVDRWGIYAALGAPELWTYGKEGLEVHLLAPDGGYLPSASSKALPLLPPAEVTRFLAQRHTTDETSFVRSFRDWVRERFPTA
jgi:Uma2 family endonuclease